MMNVATMKMDMRNAFRFAFLINVLLTCPLAGSEDTDTLSGSATTKMKKLNNKQYREQLYVSKTFIIYTTLNRQWGLSLHEACYPSLLPMYHICCK